jgi:chemotaxis protein methyltransferase WspC
MTTARSVDTLLTRQIGLDPETVGPSLIARGLQARMAALGLTNHGDYELLVRGSSRELQELVEEIVIPESWFFRDERPFNLLQELVWTRWAGRPLRGLSLPCAGGEEPYSIAIALREAGLKPERFRIDAVDVSARVLARARDAVFSRNSFRGEDLGFRNRYFHETPAGYVLDPEIRGTVRFLQGNIVDPGLLRNEPAYDFIFCRNLLIYLAEPARVAASTALDRLLGPSGALFLGHAERPEGVLARLVPLGPKGSFAYERTPAALPAADPRPALPMPPRPKVLPAPGGSRPAPVPRDVAATRAGRPLARPDSAGTTSHAPSDEPAAAAERSLARDQARIRAAREAASRAFLAQAALLADQGRYDEAAAVCEQAIREAGPSAQAFFLLGVIHQAAGDREQAEAAFHKAVYLDVRHGEALMALALIAQRRGDEATAAGYRRRAQRAMAGEEAR